jgi:hypothetical protein
MPLGVGEETSLRPYPRHNSRVPHAVTAGMASVLPAVSAPHLARSSRDVGYHRLRPQTAAGLHNTVRVPYVRTSVARIPTNQHQPRQRLRLSLKGSRTNSLNAIALDRNSGIRGPKTMGEAQPKSLIPDPKLLLIKSKIHARRKRRLKGALFPRSYKSNPARVLPLKNLFKPPMFNPRPGITCNHTIWAGDGILAITLLARQLPRCF